MICSASLFFFSLALVLGKLPEGEENAGYARGKIYYAIAGFTMGLAFFLIWNIDRDRTNMLEDAGIYLTACYIASIPYWRANLAMLAFPQASGARYNSFANISIIFFCALLWGGIYLTNRPLGRTMIILACIMLVVLTYNYGQHIYSAFKSDTRVMEGYYASDVRKRISWIGKSSQLMVVVIIAMIPMAFYGADYLSLALIALIIFDIYLYVSIANYFTDFKGLVLAKADTGQNIAKPSAIDTNETYRQINKLVEEWKSNGGPYRKDISLDQVAAELATNRTYLSNYINEVQGMSFRDWISTLKVEHAKELIEQDPTRSINEIAEAVGSSSQSFFTRKFKEIVGLTPTEYRKKYTS